MAAGWFLASLAPCTPLHAEDAVFADDEEGFKSLRVAPGLSTDETILAVLAPFMDQFPHDEEGGHSIALEMERIEGGVRFDIVETGFADDSVAGTQFRGAIFKTGNGWQLLEIRQRPVCARGKLSADGRCP